MTQQEVNLDPRQLMAALIENLDRHFYAASRDDAKQLYKALADGNIARFMHVKMEDDSELFCHLALDSTQYVGKLNFGRFRKGLAMMLLSAKKRLEKGEDLNVMNSQSGDVLFNVPGIVNADDGTNVLVCGLQQAAPGQVTIRLMYLNPDHYADAAIAGREKAEAEAAQAESADEESSQA